MNFEAFTVFSTGLSGKAVYKLTHPVAGVVDKCPIGDRAPANLRPLVGKSDAGAASRQGHTQVIHGVIVVLKSVTRFFIGSYANIAVFVHNAPSLFITATDLNLLLRELETVQ